MTPVGVNFLAPLLVHTPDVIRTVAVTMDLEPTEVAIERMLTEKTNDDAEASRQLKMNRTVDPATSPPTTAWTSAARTSRAAPPASTSSATSRSAPAPRRPSPATSAPSAPPPESRI